MPEPATTLTAVLGAIASLVSAVGSVAVDRRRRRREDVSTDLQVGRLAIDARDTHLTRLEREIARLDASLIDARRDHMACMHAHEECMVEATRLKTRVAHLEDRVEHVEQRSGDSTPTPTERI